MNTIYAAVFALTAFAAVPARAQTENWDARIAGANGDVSVLAADGSAEVSAEAGMPLEEGDRVVVAEGGSAEVSLDGGSLIAVRENSDFKIEKADKGDASFFLRVGALLAKIEKLGARRLRVRTPTAVAAVRGTEFGVEVAGEDTHVGVFDEGKVEVSGDAGAPELLISNQETSVRGGAPPAQAAQLRRFVARRAQMRGQARRLAALRAQWKALPLEERAEMRRKFMERMRERRKSFLEKRAALRQGVEQRRKSNAERGQRRRQENLRKMDERRNRINRGPRNGAP